MRKTILTLVAVLAVAFTVSSPANAGGILKKHPHKPLIVTGVVVGTLVGIGLYEGWFSNSIQANTIANSGAGAATAGFIAGVATIATIHALTTPCTGFHALFQGKGCKNGKYVGPKRAAFLWW
jgi:high-affinity Fe2+/Pb2+ permease